MVNRTAADARGAPVDGPQSDQICALSINHISFCQYLCWASWTFHLTLCGFYLFLRRCKWQAKFIKMNIWVSKGILATVFMCTSIWKWWNKCFWYTFEKNPENVFAWCEVRDQMLSEKTLDSKFKHFFKFCNFSIWIYII